MEFFDKLSDFIFKFFLSTFIWGSVVVALRVQRSVLLDEGDVGPKILLFYSHQISHSTYQLFSIIL